MSLKKEKELEKLNNIIEDRKSIHALNEKSKRLIAKYQTLSNLVDGYKSANKTIIIKSFKDKSTQISPLLESNAWAITNLVADERATEPTSNTLAKRSKERRQSETLTVSSIIHGANKTDLSPAIRGMWDTITSSSNSEQVAILVEQSKESTKNAIHDSLHKKWLLDIEQSKDNIIRSVNLYYSHDVMGKRKYVAIRKETANAKHKGRRLPNFVTYDTLMKYIKSVDIGTLYDVKEVLSKNVPEEEQGEGKFRKLSEYLPRLAEFYLRVNDDRLDKLKEYSVFPKIDASAFQFLVLFSGDGAPCKKRGLQQLFYVPF